MKINLNTWLLIAAAVTILTNVTQLYINLKAINRNT